MKNKSFLLVIGLVCACVFVLGGCGNKASEPTPTPTPTPSVSVTPTAKPLPSTKSDSFSRVPERKTIEFGTYNGEPITWLVLGTQNEKLLLISDKTLFQKAYNEKYTDITWADCTLRAYLNGEFFNNCFITEEQTKIVTTHLYNRDNPDDGTPGGADTDDKIFLLSVDEANQYFSSDDSRIYYSADGLEHDWWLRSPGMIARSAAIVYNDGSVGNVGSPVNTDKSQYVRPAMWITQ